MLEVGPFTIEHKASKIAVRAGLLDWWPDAEPWRIEKGTEVLSPFVEEAARGSVDWSHAEVVGGELAIVFQGIDASYRSQD